VALDYSFTHYSQLGGYQCVQCQFTRPEPDIEAININTADNTLQMEVHDGNDYTIVTMRTTGFYNVYNALAAFALGKVLGIDQLSIQKGLELYSPALGRMEMFRYQDKSVVLNLVKNATGLSEGLSTILSRGGTKDILIAINDQAADGRDVSWLWDVDFEALLSQLPELTSFICSGTRAEEVAVRLKYAGVPLEKISVANDPESAVTALLQGEGDCAYLLCAYTALWPARATLCRLAEKEEDHAVGLSSVS
jgi:UDP-N-acetylmuramyl tripeptide synthase